MKIFASNQNLIFVKIIQLTCVIIVDLVEQIKRVKNREKCDSKEAKKLIQLSDENKLKIDSGWDYIFESVGDFRIIAEEIVKTLN